jgi:hypothetical protein
MPVFRIPNFLTLVISAFLLSGCSYSEYFYFKNATNSNVTAIISFKEPWRDWQCDEYPADSNSLLDCRIRDMLARKLQFKALDKFTISVNLPANSRTHIGNSTNRPLYADSVILIKGAITERYSFMDLYKKSTSPAYNGKRRVVYRIE